MNETNKKDTGKDELLELALYNDVLDIFLFIIGFLLPFGDYFESIVGGAFDVLLFIWMFQVIRGNAIWLLALECIDLTDLFTRGFWDVFGWVEVLPFWYLYYKDLTLELKAAEKSNQILEDSNLPKLAATQKSQKTVIETEKTCPNCGNTTPENILVCELCGAIFKNK